jgi:hypothetical protein
MATEARNGVDLGSRRTLPMPRAGGALLGWSRWWPAGFILAACIFGLTYLRAWSGETSGLHLLFWAAIATMVVSVAGLIAAGPTRAAGFVASLALGGLLYLPKLFHSPAFFNYFDELAHWRALEHLNGDHGLFLANPINKAVEFFPGLAATAGALSSLTGLSPFVAGNVLIAVVHALMLGALFLLYERISGSSRVALLSVVVFAANPAYIFFDSYFAYESFALPLAASALTAVVLSDNTGVRTSNGLMSVALALCLAIVVSHHVTSWVLAVLFLALGLAAIWAQTWTASISRRLILAAAVTAVAAGAWILFVAPYTVEYVSPTLRESADAVSRFFGGSSEHRQPFARSTAPLYEKYGTYLAVLLLAVAFGLTLLRITRRREWRQKYFSAAFAAIGVTYFLSIPVSFLISNSSVNRVWEFAFIGLAPIVAASLVPLLRGGNALKTALGTAAIFIIFLGGVVERTSLHQGLPGPYEPTADPLSMTAEVFAASNWLEGRYGRNNIVTGDRAGFEVFGGYGNQNVISGQENGARPWRIFFPRSITQPVLTELDRDRVRFLVIDRRITEQVPIVDWYYSPNEPQSGTRTEPLAKASLDKFASSPLFDRIYDAGNVLIYEYFPNRQ